jgi:glycerol-3-phosphate acyltransferase PlsX
MQMRIALDAMGTDGYPVVEVQGAIQALSEIPGEFEILLIGDRERIEASLAEQGDYPRDRLHLVHAAQRIEQCDPPAAAVRRKLDSSIAVGLRLQKEGEAHAFISAGSTGAVMAASLFILRPLPGVARPPIATLFPTSTEPVVLLDSGANVDCKPTHLVQFALLGSIYAREVLCRSQPRVGLLNIGEEPEKGDELAVAAHQLLRESPLNFIGNVEGRDILSGHSDVVVTDGFVGNVLLKFYESVPGIVSDLVRREMSRCGVQLDLDRIIRPLDYAEYGGAPLLGVDGITIICHGGSSPRAIKNAIQLAIRSAESNVVGQMKHELALALRNPTGVEGAGVGRLAEGA